MPRVTWPLSNDRPCVTVVLTLMDGTEVDAELLADSGGGAAHSRFELVLPEDECLLCGGKPSGDVILTGAYVGLFPRYSLRVVISALGFDQDLFVAGVHSVADFGGIACFRLLNRFGYGNFGDSGLFGLETLTAPLVQPGSQAVEWKGSAQLVRCPMDDLTAICRANKELAHQINEEARVNPSSPFAGKFVGIANGQVVVVADDLTTMSRRLGQIEPDPRRVFCLDAGHDPNEITRV